jgi:hypothetical protein
MSWISLHDQIAALRFLVERDDITGPVNLTSPEPVTNAEFTKALGRSVHRPAVLAVPSFALRAALDGFADEGLLVSQRVRPARLADAGFAFQHPGLESALESAQRTR